MAHKIPIGISSCLLGNEVRYDGGHKHHSYITGTLGNYFDFVPFCPEVGAGLGVPREPIRLVSKGNQTRAVGVRDPQLDATDNLRAFAADNANAIAGLCGFILKRASPSCGMERVKVYDDKGMPSTTDSGIFAAALIKSFPRLPVEEEGRLGDARLRENFIERVFFYWRWARMTADLSVAGLTEFHAGHKLNFMSHQQNNARELGRIAASAKRENLVQVADAYLALAMQTLKRIATPKNHVNVLHHAMGYLKTQLDGDDKQELLETIEAYRQDQVPLIVPITLLKHHFRRQPHPYIENSYYFSPYPAELRLRNTV